jgi:hypothetical protein
MTRHCQKSPRAWILLCTVTAMTSAFAQYQGLRGQNQSGQIRIDPNQPVPPEAWRNMDTHAPIDPRVHRLLLEKEAAAKRAAERQRKFQQAMARYNPSELRRASQAGLYVGDPAVQVAVSASAQYLALREVDGASAAVTWLSQFKTGLDQRIRAMETPNPEMLKEAIVGTASILALNPHISDYPRQLDELKRTKVALAKLGR